MEETSGLLDRGDGIRLGWSHLAGAQPTIVFLPGFHSDRNGSKALALRDWCAQRQQALLRLDYAGHGDSDGNFTDGTIGSWTQDAITIIDRQTKGPLLLVGSSMGGWIALLTSLARPDRVLSLVGIAAAPDFTERLMWDCMAPPERAALLRDGVLHVPSQYGEPMPITRALIEEGRTHLLLGAPIPIDVPVRLLQGQRDQDVPWETALHLAARLASNDVRIILIKDGDHRLSRPTDLAVLTDALAGLLGQNGA